MFHVGLVAVVTCTDRHPARGPRRVIEILQPVQVVQVPRDGGVLSVDLEGVKRLMPAA